MLTMLILKAVLITATLWHETVVAAFIFPDEDQCHNPNGRLGKCISIYQCDSLRNVLAERRSINYGFVQASECQRSGAREFPPFVCCTSDTKFLPTERNRDGRIIYPDATSTSTSTWAPEKHGEPMINVDAEVEKFPKPPECGAVSISNKIYGGVETELDEYSWMVNLEYRRVDGSVVSVCAGSIINERYVLTAAHCVKGMIEKAVGKLVSLRAGVHNTETAADCIGSKCLPPAQQFGISSVKVHEAYGSDSDIGIRDHNDIALIRLDRAITFTDTLQPVCLPDAGDPVDLSDGMRLTVAGWGHNGTVKHTAEKRKVSVPIMDLQKCRRAYDKITYIADEQFCAGGVFREDSCTGDSGGPLMRLTAGTWFLEGLVSYGRGCGLEIPGVYTRVRSYLDWIDRNVEL